MAIAKITVRTVEQLEPVAAFGTPLCRASGCADRLMGLITTFGSARMACSRCAALGGMVRPGHAREHARKLSAFSVRWLGGAIPLPSQFQPKPLALKWNATSAGNRPR